MDKEQEIFENGSTTYYLSSRFFPKNVREDVFRLHSFVRVADDYADEQPSRPEKLKKLEKRFNKAAKNPKYKTDATEKDLEETRALKNIIFLMRKYDYEKEWVDSFFKSMKMDINPKRYKTLDESLEYVYGSAEVIGLMMSRILGINSEVPVDKQRLLEYAKLQGRAMQWINFVRDIDEDVKIGRCYFPQADLKHFKLKDLSYQTAVENEDKFSRFVRYQIARYRDWQDEAAKGFKHIPRRQLVPLKTANDMYEWTANVIDEDPMVVYSEKVEPKRWRVVSAVLRNMIRVT